jgi:aryl-alcohol dehydrogenase-like predicted oxidoreductase
LPACAAQTGGIDAREINMQLPQRRIGNSGMHSSALGLGCMGMSEFYGATDETQSLATLEAALAAGVTLFDTADAYGFGHNEQLLGRFLKHHRGQALVATKCGLAREAGSYARRVDNSPPTSARPAKRRWRAWAWRASTCSTCTA